MPTPNLPNRLDLVVDADGGAIIRDFVSKKIAPPITLAVGDTRDISVRVVRPSTGQNPDQPWLEIPTDNASFGVSVGVLNGKPTAGTFQLTFLGNGEVTTQTSSNLVYNASASNVQAEFNKLTQVQARGNVVVTSPSTGVYNMIWNSTGYKGTVGSAVDALFPESTVSADLTRNGVTSTTRQVNTISIERDAIASAELTTALAPAAATIATVTEGVTDTTAEIQTVLLDPIPFDGTFTLTTNIASAVASAAIDYNATPAALQAAIIATDSTNLTSKVTVTGAFPKWTVTFASSLGNVATMTSDVNNLRVPNGFSGSLAIGTGKSIQNLLGANSIDATLEVVVTNTVASTEYTAAQAPCIIRQDLNTF